MAAAMSALVNPLLRAAIGEARRHPFDVVLERSRQGLVEVVQIEQQDSLWRCEHAEVRQMGVTTELDFQARVRCVLEIGGHDLGRAPIEGERRHHHPTVTNGDQIRFPGQVLRLQQRHRVGPVVSWFPSAVTPERRPLAARLAHQPAFFDTRVRHCCDGHRSCLLSLLLDTRPGESFP